MQINELRSKSDEELVQELNQLNVRLQSDRLRHRLGKLVNTSTLKQSRRDIARVQMLLSEREKQAGLNPGSLYGKYGRSLPLNQGSGAAGEGFLSSMLDAGQASE